MEQLTVRMNEWFFTQGLVGYKKILEDFGEKVKTTYDGIIIEKKHLIKLPEAYFSYYLKNYSAAERNERKIRRLHNLFVNGEKTAKTELNKELNELKKSIHRYFKDTNEGIRIGELADAYRKEKNYQHEMDEWVNEFIQLLYTKAIDEKLTSNFFKTVLLNPFFGQVSFLNVTNNKKTIQEQKEIFFRDFIYPILEEWKLIDAIQEENKERIDKILSDTNYNSFNSFKRKFKKMSVEEMKDYIENEIHRCSLTDFPLAFQNFEEKIFTPLSLSLDKARNMSWNANQKEYIPVSSLARLIIFCAQAGGTDTHNKSTFIFYGGAFDEIYQVNKSYGDLKSDQKTFDEVIFDLVREQKVKADYLNRRYIIYEYESEYESKRTLLDYMIMTPDLVKLFSEESKLFDPLHHTNKTKIIKLLLHRIDPKHFIMDELRERIQKNYPVFNVIRLVKIRHLSKCLKEDILVDKTIEKRRVWALVKSAEEVRNKIGTKKAQGIAYRLLNSVRSNDKNTFMDTVMRVYISSDLEMPGLLLEALHEEKMDFATVGNAWIAGLISKTDENKGEDQNE